MKKLALVLSLLPVVALAAQQAGGGRGPGPGPGGPGAGPGAGPGPDDAAWMQRVQKRVRLAATLGLAEVLDLDDQGTMRVRDLIARYSDKRMPLQRQLWDSMRIVRDAARGDQAAMGQVDAALTRLRDTRSQIHKLDDDLFTQLTQGLSPDKKAKAALFLARFRERARHMAMMRGGAPGWGHGRGGGPGFGPRGGFGDERMGPGAPGMRGMMGPGPERHAMADGNEADLEDWFAGE